MPNETNVLTELWMLRISDCEEPLAFMRANDECGDPWLCFASEEDAAESASYHRETFDIDSVPEKVIG